MSWCIRARIMATHPLTDATWLAANWLGHVTALVVEHDIVNKNFQPVIAASFLSKISHHPKSLFATDIIQYVIPARICFVCAFLTRYAIQRSNGQRLLCFSFLLWSEWHFRYLRILRLRSTLQTEERWIKQHLIPTDKFVGAQRTLYQKATLTKRYSC